MTEKGDERCLSNLECHQLVNSNLSSCVFFQENGQIKSEKNFMFRNHSDFKLDNRGKWNIRKGGKGSLFWKWMVIRYQDSLKCIFRARSFSHGNFGVDFKDIELKNKTEDEIIDLL
jgi:hypothetical protein